MGRPGITMAQRVDYNNGFAVLEAKAPLHRCVDMRRALGTDMDARKEGDRWAYDIKVYLTVATAWVMATYYDKTSALLAHQELKTTWRCGDLMQFRWTEDVLPDGTKITHEKDPEESLDPWSE